MRRLMLAAVASVVALAFVGGAALADVKVPGPLGLPSVEVLREKLTLSETQTKQVETIYEEYKDKAKEVEDKGDSKAKAQVRGEIVGKIKEICSADQKKMLDHVVAEGSK